MDNRWLEDDSWHDKWFEKEEECMSRDRRAANALLIGGVTAAQYEALLDSGIFKSGQIIIGTVPVSDGSIKHWSSKPEFKPEKLIGRITCLIDEE